MQVLLVDARAAAGLSLLRRPRLRRDSLRGQVGGDLNRPGFRGGGLVKVLRFPEPQTVFACRSSVQLQLVEYSRLSLTGVCC